MTDALAVNPQDALMMRPQAPQAPGGADDPNELLDYIRTLQSGEQTDPLDKYGRPLIREVSPVERYKFQPDVPEAVKRATPDYGLVARGQKQGGRYSEMTPAEQEAFAAGFIRAAGMGASFVNPVLGAGIMGSEALSEGDPKGALIDAASAAVPYGLAKFPKAGAAALGGYLTAGTSTSTGGGLIDSLPKEERAAYADRLRQAQGITNKKRRDEEIGRINKEISDKVSERAEKERTLANDKQADVDWQNRNKAAIETLKKTQQEQIYGAKNLVERQYLFDKFKQEQTEAGKTFAEKHAQELEWLRAATAGIGVAIPATQRVRQVGSLERATRDAEAAYAAAAKGRPTSTVKSDLAMKTGVLGEMSNIPSGAREFAKELGYGSLLPYTAATFTPNALEAAGRFATGAPEDRDVAFRALKNMIDPAAVGVSVGEGALATLGGQFLGRGIKNADVAEARAKGVLGTIEKAAKEKKDAAAKAAATRAANRAAKQAGQKPGGRGKTAPVLIPAIGAGAGAGAAYLDPLSSVDPLSQQ